MASFDPWLYPRWDFTSVPLKVEVINDMWKLIRRKTTRDNVNLHS